MSFFPRSPWESVEKRENNRSFGMCFHFPLKALREGSMPCLGARLGIQPHGPQND